MASGDTRPFRPYVLSIADGGSTYALSGLPVVWGSDTIKVALLTVAPDWSSTTTDLHWDDVSGNEVSSAGTYPTGGVVIANITVTWDTDVVKIDGDDAVIAKDAANGFSNAIAAVTYKDTGTPATSPLLLYHDLGAATGNTVADYVFQWGATGIWRMPIVDGL